MKDEIAESESPDSEKKSMETRWWAVPGGTEADQGSNASIEVPKRRQCRFRMLGKAVGLAAVFILLVLGGLGGGIVWYYWDTSSEFDLSDIENLEVGAMVVDVQGNRIGRIGTFDRVLIASDDLPEHFVDALIAAEDQRYFSHRGFDAVGMLRAAITNLKAGNIREGASTLTQQLARNVYPLTAKSIDRKLLEVALAARIESRYSKEEVLQHYLNRVYFGSGCYGVGSAARRFFGKQVSDLTVGESAMICGVIRSPSRLSPFENLDAAKASRDRTLARMVQCGTLSTEEMAREKEKPTLITAEESDQQSHQQCRYLLGRVEKEVQGLLDGRSMERITIQTTVDLALQQTGTANLNDHLEELTGRFNLSEEKASHLQGAIVMLDNKTGEVVVSIGSRDFTRSQFDRAWNLRRPAGSAFFPLVYAAAFEQDDFDPATRVLDAPVDNRKVMIGGVEGVLGEWSTEDEANRWEGRISAAHAFRKSKNSPTVRVGVQAGIDKVQEVASDLGVTSELRPYAGTFLGASEVGLMELARAYTAFANGGEPAPRPSVVREITDSKGNTIYSRKTDASLNDAGGISVETAVLLKKLMRLTGSKYGTRVSGKSGTTSGYTDAWFIGFTDHHTWGVWVGMDEFDTIADKAFGSDIARPVWDTMVSRVLTREDTEAHSVAGGENRAKKRGIASSASIKDFEVSGKAGEKPESRKANVAAAFEAMER